MFITDQASKTGRGPRRPGPNSSLFRRTRQHAATNAPRFLGLETELPPRPMSDSQAAQWDILMEAAASGATVAATLRRRNSGGWLVECARVDGFMPISHAGEYRDVSEGPLPDVRVVVMEAQPPERYGEPGRLIVSRRMAVPEAEGRARLREKRQERAAAAWQGFRPGVGDIYRGTVSGIADYGVFVLLDNEVPGLVHVSALMDEGPGVDPMDGYRVGQRVRVSVAYADTARRRLSLRFLED